MTRAARTLPARLDAVICDMDGTLLDTEALYRDAFMAAARSLGVAVSAAAYDELVGIATRERGPILRARYGPDFPWEALRCRYYRERAERARDNLRVKPGALRLLRHCERLGLPKAIATTASRATAEAHLRATALWHRFDAVVTRDDVERGKPHPDAFARAARALGAAPGRCLALEDSEPGITAAALAGMLPVVVRDRIPPSAAVRARSVAVVDGLDELCALLGG